MVFDITDVEHVLALSVDVAEALWEVEARFIEGPVHEADL